MNEDNYYWVRRHGRDAAWEPALIENGGQVWCVGDDVPRTVEWLAEIGPSIGAPIDT